MEDLWSSNLTAYEFVKRVPELKAEKNFTDKEGVHQILVNAARGKLREAGTIEFDCSVSESSDTKPRGKVERTKKCSSNKEEPKTKTKSNQCGSSRDTTKKRCLRTRREENTSRVTKSNDQPPPKKSRRGSFSQHYLGNSRRNSPSGHYQRSPPREYRCRHCRRTVDRCDYVCSGCCRPNDY